MVISIYLQIFHIIKTIVNAKVIHLISTTQKSVI
jgi:hypothetical protein